jgi:hypothetical protein
VKPSVGLLAAACALAPSAANAFSPYLVVPDPRVAEASPAYRFANMTDGEALAELDRRGILYTRVDPVPGVRAPVRITGRLHGVWVHSSLPPEQRVRSYFEILDARLALALDDFCALLERHDIDEVVHFTMYRPNVAPPDHGARDDVLASAGKPAGGRPRPMQALGKGTVEARRSKFGMSGGLKQKTDDHPQKPAPGTVRAPRKNHGVKKSVAPAAVAEHPTTRSTTARRDPVGTGLHATTWAAPGTRHPAGLAIDVASFHKKDGRWVTVHHDFHGHLGAKTCGEGVVEPENPDARELHGLVCEALERGIFTYVLTPNYNAAHADHFHMEIKPGVRWFLYN